MYSMCGNILKAHKIFDKLQQKDNLTMKSLMMGLVINGFVEDAISPYSIVK